MTEMAQSRVSIMIRVRKGQTGADRAGLDVALDLDISHGGWCPKGRQALDGPLDLKYRLVETPGSAYLQRTEWTVRDSDATVIFTLSERLSGGSSKTKGFAAKHEKPVLHVSPAVPQPEEVVSAFIVEHSGGILNVARSRESK